MPLAFSTLFPDARKLKLPVSLAGLGREKKEETDKVRRTDVRLRGRTVVC